jgi:hypothetical protein
VRVRPGRARARGTLEVLVALALLGGIATRRLRASGEDLGTAFEVDTSDHFGRMRVFAAPGDLGLHNRAVTAIVRRRDGVLVDFWPNRPQPATVAQLGDVLNVDGLWEWRQRLAANGHSSSVTAGSIAGITAVHDAIELQSSLSLGKSDFEVRTRFHLAEGDGARLEVETRVTLVQGSAPVGLQLYDTIKWGNVPVYAAGRGRIDGTFTGNVAWVGRKGASGDLALESEADRPFHVSLHGAGAFAPATVAASEAGTIAPGQSVTIRRWLAYRDIPDALNQDALEEPRDVGTVTVELVDERGSPLAAKLAFSGKRGTRDPQFGTRGDVTGAGRFVWTGTGKASRALPPGSYEILASAGPERAIARFSVDVRPNEGTVLRGSLPRLLETPGWISADLHLHQVASIDADVSFDNRVIAVAAEGVELAVATDHYVVTDLEPTVRALQRHGHLHTPLATLPGSEISTTGHRFGHFNAFPLPLDAELAYHDVTPQALFASARRASPTGVIQVNHPRWNNIGYFRVIEMDPKTGEVPASHHDLWADDFDAIEVFNGVDAESEAAVLAPFFDWMNLLSRGHRYTATGNSDSHNLYYLDPGLPRNMIRWGDGSSDAEDVRAPVTDIIDALRAGRVVVTSGPLLDVSIGDAMPGDTFETTASRVDVHVRARAVPWVDVSRLRLFVDGRHVPVVDQPIPHSDDLQRLDRTFSLAVRDGGFVIALVTGSRPLPNVHVRNARPLAFSNPIWVRRPEAAR